MIIDKTKPHAIFLDIDGTLTSIEPANSLGSEIIPERNIRAINAAREKGHKVILNTGRGKAALPKCFLENKIQVDGFITGLGTYIEIDGKVLYNNHITVEILEELLDFICKKHLPCRFQGRKSLIVCDPVREYTPLWTKVTTKEEFFRALGDDTVIKITIDHMLNGEYLEFINERLHSYTSKNAGEAAMKGCDKATAMLMVLDALGIPAERSIAMGDSGNDIEVLKTAGTSVATANASDNVKAVCDIVTLSDVEGGVGKAIEDLLL